MVSVNVNGSSYTDFKQVDYSRSIDELCGQVRLIITEPANNDSIIKINDKIELYFDDILTFTGYAEKIKDMESNDSHDIGIDCRDLTCDLIDSTCPDDVKTVTDNTTYSNLVSSCIDGLGLGISVIDNVNATIEGDIKAAEIGEKCFEFLNRYARQAQIFLNTDSSGNVIIRQPGGTLITYLLSDEGNINNNILDSEINLDYTNRYNTYIVRSNNNLASDLNTDNLNVAGSAKDTAIRETRIYEKIADVHMTEDECINAAIEEANIRRIRSFNYSCKVAGFSANGELWDIAKLVNVYDVKKGVVGLFVINSISCNYSANGEFTTLNLTLPDAYKLQAELTAAESQTVEQASTYNAG